jgi:hypothetical protein
MHRISTHGTIEYTDPSSPKISEAIGIPSKESNHQVSGATVLYKRASVALIPSHILSCVNKHLPQTNANMRLSSLIHFATLAIPYVTAGSMGFSMQAPVGIADVMDVKGKHESEEDFVKMPIVWSGAYGNPESCMDEAGTINYTTSNGECGDKPMNKLVAVFPDLIEGKNLLDIKTPDYTLSVSDHL